MNTAVDQAIQGVDRTIWDAEQKLSNGLFQESTAAVNKAIALVKKIPGKNQPYLARAQALMGRILLLTGNTELGCEYTRKAVSVLLENESTYHDACLPMVELAAVYLANRLFVEADTLLKTAGIIAIKGGVPQQRNLLNVYHMKARSARIQGRYVDALKIYLQDVPRDVSMFSNDNKYQTEVYSGISGIYHKMGEDKQALSAARKACQLASEGEHSVAALISSLRLLMNDEINNKQWDEAKKHALQGLRLVERSLGFNSQQTLEWLSAINAICKNTKDRATGDQVEQRIEAIRQKKNHPTLIGWLKGHRQ